MPITDADQFGAFIQTTQVYDLNIEQVDVNSAEFKELILRLYQNTNNIINVLNVKDTGLYQLSEFVNGQLFFANPALSSTTAQYPEDRQVIRKVLNVGPLLIVGANTFAHGITCTTRTTFTRIYGVANKTTVPFSYLPLPYVSTVAIGEQISITVDATNVIINTGTTNRSAYNICYIVLEFLQS